MDTFEPQPWEIPFDGAIYDDEESVARTYHPLNGADVEWHLRLILSEPYPHWKRKGWKARKIPLLSLPERWPDAGFVVCGEDSTSLISRRYVIETISEKTTFIEAWQNNKIARLFWLNERGELRQLGETASESLLVTASGIAAWQHYAPSHVPGAFSWMTPLTSNEFAAFPALELWAGIQQSLEEQGSEPTFARRFARLEDDERHALVFKWKRGNEDELKSVLRDIFLAHNIWNVCEEIRQCDEGRLILSAPHELEIEFENSNAICEVPIPTSLLNSIKTLLQWFEPFDTEMVNRRCVQDWMRWSQSHLEVSARRPTAHEQLEAHQRCRQWEKETQ